MPLLKSRCNPLPPGATTVAVIDLGSNSFHMLIAYVLPDRIVVPVTTCKRQVQLRSGINADGELSPQIEKKALACLRYFAKYLKRHQVRHVRAVGTYTLRQAKNKGHFLAEAEAILGHKLQVITGKEEARLIYVGASYRARLCKQHLVIDIGGGSTELIIGEQRDTKVLTSLDMGCVSFQERFFAGGQITPERFQQAQCCAQQKLLRVYDRFQEIGWQRVLGSSGTVLTVASICKHRQVPFSVRELRGLRDELCEFGKTKKIRLPGLRLDRREILPGGLAILLAIFEVFALKRLSLSRGGVREGVMFELVDTLFNHQ